ncbi:unnamed protein product [Zymoseptoria tritici ST99CH_1E4]|uniref:MJ1316 RNA cyclic group end recognition domain-containing protein n=1 Tax=Zymoseptoria tritici ST99CH_1E4 TaxID=1276532 RepID=A0A2H1FJB1_ZYMTR|nr:unnamed protein product [Zymoseptoria tritici ST99CH_1E4]
MSERPELFIERAYNDAEAMAWSDKDMCFTSENYYRYFALLATIRKISAVLDFQYVTPKNVFHVKDPRDQDLRDDLQRPRGQFPRYLFPTAPFAIGICPADEVVELICVADMSARTFSERVTERLLAEGLVPLMRDYNDHLGRIALIGPQELAIRFEICSPGPRGNVPRCVLVLRYQRKPAEFDNQITRERRITEAMAKESPSLARVYTQQIWNQRILDLWDALYHPKPPAGILPTPDDAGPSENEAPPPTVLLHHEFLRLHRLTRNLGLMSPRLGLLSTEILLQAWTVAMCIDVQESLNGGPSRSLKNCLWHLDRILKRSRYTPSGNWLCPSAGHEVFLLNTEGIDAASICLTDLMDQTNLANLNANGSSPASGLRYFASTYPLYIKIDANCWAARQRLRFADTFFDVLAALQQSVRTDTRGQTRARPWPFRLTRREEYGEGSSIYLLGLYTRPSGDILVLPSHLQDGSLNAHVNTLFDIAFQDSDFDQTKCFIESELLTPETLISFLESIDVVQSHIAECRGLSDPLLPESDFSPTTTAPMTDTPMDAPLAMGDSDPGNTNAVPDRPSNTSVDSSRRFRPDTSVISRLRYDPAHQDIEYEVGYQDRFLDDLVWKPLDDWQRATEEEDFVPSHRIRQIRRLWDGVVVWDREARFDMT